MNGTAALAIAVLAAFTAGWGALWWRVGRIEGCVKHSQKEWEALKAKCPLCRERE